MKEYRVSNGKSMRIKADYPEDAKEIFLDSFNECQCDVVSVHEITTLKPSEVTK